MLAQADQMIESVQQALRIRAFITVKSAVK